MSIATIAWGSVTGTWFGAEAAMKIPLLKSLVIPSIDLSMCLSSTSLIGIPYFKESFPLRCIQRLSRPYIATQRCGWRHNWYTIGTSTPVLSY